MRLLFGAFFLLCAIIRLDAQEITNVTASWVNLEMDLEWNDDIDMKLTQSTRFQDILGDLSASNTTFKLSYGINKWLKVTGGYRYSYRSRKDRKFHRYQLALQARKKIEDLRLTWRTRFEYRKAIMRDNEVSRLRNRFTATYKIKKLDITPKIFGEYWYTFDEPLQNFSKYRFGVAVSKSISKKAEINVGYSYDGDLNQDEIERENIFIIGYTYNFQRNKATKN